MRVGGPVLVHKPSFDIRIPIIIFLLLLVIGNQKHKQSFVSWRINERTPVGCSLSISVYPYIFNMGLKFYDRIPFELSIRLLFRQNFTNSHFWNTMAMRIKMLPQNGFSHNVVWYLRVVTRSTYFHRLCYAHVALLCTYEGYTH